MLYPNGNSAKEWRSTGKVAEEALGPMNLRIAALSITAQGLLWSGLVFWIMKTRKIIWFYVLPNQFVTSRKLYELILL
jgi:hypothetical protein